jgi:hypothetical protein
LLGESDWEYCVPDSVQAAARCVGRTREEDLVSNETRRACDEVDAVRKTEE